MEKGDVLLVTKLDRLRRDTAFEQIADKHGRIGCLFSKVVLFLL